MGRVTFFIKKQGTNERDVTVSFSTVNGSATGEVINTCRKCSYKSILLVLLSAPGDYVATTNQSVTFSPSDTILNVTVPITDDSVYELQETFSAMLTTTDPGVEIIADTASATITDNGSEFAVAAVISMYNL